MRSNIMRLGLLCLLLGACSESDEPASPPDTSYDDASYDDASNLRIELVKHFAMNEGLFDVWGHVDASGREYALVGTEFNSTQQGLKIIDVTEPENPVVVSEFTDVAGFDVKIWQNYLYAVNGGGSGEGRILDISDMRGPRVVGSFPQAHNIWISQDGYLYLESPGLRIFDLRDSPTSPRQIWADGKGGHDAAVVGDRLYDFRGTAGTNIYDIRNPAEPQLLGAIRPAFIRFHHSGWPTEDGHYLFITDEGATGEAFDITAWDISDPSNPELVANYNDPNATVHNLYIIDNVALVSYYSAGFRIFDVSDPASGFPMVDEYDTSQLAGDNFAGAFGVYPFLPSGTILVSDVETGLYLFRLVAATQPVNTVPVK